MNQQQLVTDYIGFAQRVAASWQARWDAHPDRDDFPGAAYFGLCKAAWKYTPERGVKFHLYAKPWISGEIRGVIRKALPKTFRFNRYRGDRPMPNVVSLRGPIVADEEAVGAALEAVEEVYRLTRSLAKRDAAAVRDYYCDCMTQARIRQRRGASQTRVSKTHDRAIAELQRHMGATA